ncbi:hypothetical protein WJX72_003664 [[Myrmecia] bisecta]|uniref:Formin-like protein n=1 Tax=[Myrmecia] bisecta TaxID=41462 RepID=A0AAW1PJU1_9CHLO
MGSFSLLRSSNTLEPAPVTPRKARRKSDTTPPERVSLFRSLWPGASSSKPAKEKELPIHITEKIWGLVFEEDRVSWNQSCRSPKLTDRYKQYLLAAAAGLEEMEPEWDNVMVLNLGPTWSSSEAYKIFKDKVLEPANHSWECPPGLGICGLDALFSVCQQIHRWLAVDDANVVVLHCRGFSGAGLLFLYLITACYGLYSREFSRLDDAFEALPNPKTQHVATSTGEMLKLKGTLGAAQRHYGEYMLKVMYSQTLPSARRSKMSLQRIVFNACDQIRMGQPVGEPGLTASPSQPERSSGSSSSTPKHSDRRFSTIQSAFLVVYQRGVQVWAGAAATEDSMVGYEINRPISGDITIGLWFGDHKGEWDSPVMAYAFHTAFADHGLKRVRALHIDVPGNSAFDPEVAETEGFFMDIMLEEELLPVDARVSQDLDARGLQELKYEWQATIAQYDSPAKHSSVRHNMIRELRATQEAGLAPSELEAATGLTGADADASTSSPDSASASTAGQAGANTEPSRPAPAPAAAKKGPPPPPPPPPPGGKPAGSPGPKGPPPPPPPPGGKGPPVAPPPPPGGTRKGPPLPPPPMPGKGKTRRNSGEAAAAAGGHALAAGSAVLGPEQASIGAGTAALAPGYGPPKFRVLHWVKVPRGSTTLWAQLPAPIPGLPPPFPFALEQLFAVKPTKGLKGGKAKKGPTESVKVIGLARANNVSIMMTQFAEFKGGPVEVRHAVLTGSKLGMERLSLLLQIAPTDDEAKSLQKWLAAPGNRFSELSSPEQFLSVMATLPRLRAKVAALIFRRQYEGLMRDASGALACLNTACEQVRTSARLRKVIQSVLTVGNALNIGTAYGNAEGIQLSSLLKLAELKVTGPAGSVVVESRTAAGAAAAMAVQQAAAQAAIPPIRTLLEFVAWMVVSQAAAAGTLKKGGYLVEELSQLGEAVRRIQAMVAEEEARFAGVLGEFLESATNGKQQLMEMVKQTDVHVAQLAAWLGQPLDCDPAVMLGTLWTFALSFDQAARNMARCMAADTK